MLHTDAEFDANYPESIRKHSFIHWTPIEIVETAIDWLDLDAQSRVLDIGSGAGKFCVVGAMRSKASFTGVEMRKDLVDAARHIAKEYEVSNVTFLHENIEQIDFSQFSHFYYYNPFCEYIAEFDRIDTAVTYDPHLFRHYEDIVIEAFETLPVGTRVVSYCSGTFPFPASYRLSNLLYDGKLALFIKET
jgi:SAM-dependent methyltransferase